MNKNFYFNLHKVLEIRSLEEDLALLKLQEARQKAEEIKEQLDDLNSMMTNLYQFLRQEDLTVEERIQGRDFIALQRQKIDRTQKLLTNQFAVVTQRQGEVIDKKREREVLEKLQEKEYERYIKELLRKEQKELDEIGQRAKGLQGGIR